jgi:hypothetical protein
MEASEEFVVPSWSSRLKALGVIALVLLWIESHRYWVAPLLESFGAPNDPLLEIKQAWFTTLYFSGVLMAVACIFAWRAIRVIRYRQTPVQNEWLLVKHRVRRGRAAMMFAASQALGALLFVGLSMYVAYSLQPWGLSVGTAPCGGPVG